MRAVGVTQHQKAADSPVEFTVNGQGYETIPVEDESDIKDITGENGMIAAHRTLCESCTIAHIASASASEMLSQLIVLACRLCVQELCRPRRWRHQRSPAWSGPATVSMVQGHDRSMAGVRADYFLVAARATQLQRLAADEEDGGVHWVMHCIPMGQSGRHLATNVPDARCAVRHGTTALRVVSVL